MKEAPSEYYKKVTGNRGEDMAEEALQKRGYRVVDRQYESIFGEIDIVCDDGKTLVFVEVRRKKKEAYGTPEESVTVGKQRKIIKAAMAYMMEKNLLNRFVRFDVIAIDRDEMRIHENAFSASGNFFF